MRIGCISVCPIYRPWGEAYAFVGIECAKGRGIILPGGEYEPAKDASYHHAACRELLEETGIVAAPEYVKYLFHGPDGGDFITFAFYTDRWFESPKDMGSGYPVEASWSDLLSSKFGAYYRVLHDIMKGNYEI